MGHDSRVGSPDGEAGTTRRRREEQPASAADEEAVRREREVEERHGCVCGGTETSGAACNAAAEIRICISEVYSRLNFRGNY